MSAAAETTMPAQSAGVVDLAGARVLRMQSCTRRPAAVEVDERQAVDELAAAQARITELEQQVAELTARNREIAADLDNALDELSGHALHAEQERLVHPPMWTPWTASMSQEGHER